MEGAAIMRRSTTRGRRGEWLLTDDRTGQTIWSGDARREWNGLIVHKSVYEPRHPIDYLRSRPDRSLTVPFARPEPTPVFIGPLVTIIAEDEAGDENQYAPMGPLGAFALGQTDDGGSNNIESNQAGADTITVASAARFEIGDRLGIVLDSGDVFSAQIEYLTGPNTLQLTSILPGATSPGNKVFNYTSTV
jgi:hypothetical protein